MDKSNHLKFIIEQIVQIFLSDSFIELDCVLTDDKTDPQHSANTVYNRLDLIVKYMHAAHQGKKQNVFDFIVEHGYSAEDVERFKGLLEKEDYHGVSKYKE